MKNKNSANTLIEEFDPKLITDTIMEEFDLTLIANFFKKLNRQGPGADAETLKALSFVTNLPPKAKIADIGCGTGQQTSALASNLDCTISAVDLLPELIDGLNERVKKDNLESKITSILASMYELPFKLNDFDLIWAEGSIYNIGFERGLTEWRKYIKPNGFIAVTECCWLSNARPKDCSYLTENFKEIDSISNKLRIMTNAGYLPVAHFILPEYCWLDNYYALVHSRMQEFLDENNNSEKARQFVDRMEEEIAHYHKNKAYFGYVFYIGQKAD